MLFKIQILIFLHFCSCLYSQDIVEFKKISSENLGNIVSTKLLSDSIKFDGYIIFEFPMENKFTNTTNSVQYVISNFYFVESLDNIFEQNKRYYFDSYDIILKDFYYQCITEFENHKQDTDFISFYETYNNLRYKNSTLLPFLYRPLTTEIFFQEIEPFYMNETESKVSFFFKASFIGTTFQMDREVLNESNDRKIITVISIYPISKVCVFEPTSEFEILQNGFKKSSWFPDYLFKTKH